MGKAQGRAQTRHDEAANTLVEGLRLTRRVGTECGMWALYQERDADERRYQEEILLLRGKLQDLVYDNSPWLDPRTEGTLRPILKDLAVYNRSHRAALKSGNKKQAQKTGEQLSKWSINELIQMENDMENEARRVIGTKRRWSQTRWGKPLAWITRNTRLLTAYSRIKRKLGRFAGTLVMVFVVGGLTMSIYWFAT